MLSASLTAILVLLPAALRWWWGRALARHFEDPALPERLYANQRRNQVALFFCIILLFYWQPVSPLLSLPALVILRAIAGYPFRKRLYGETWSVIAYLSFFGRLLVGVYGFWILLLYVPVAAGWFGSLDWAAGLAFSVVLIVWHERASEFIRWILGARPITDPVLLPRFEQMASMACGANPPHFEYVDLQGGALANAVALPSLRRSGVLFTNTLLALLDGDEIVAICAHELAHLEYYNPQRLRRARIVNLVLIAIAAASATIARLVPSVFTSLVDLPLVVGVTAVLFWRAKDRQKNETASDLRAIALCGNGEALANGLAKLYGFARVPRRFDSQRERTATHPSLARRIRDIRAASGVAPAPVTVSATFAAADGRAGVEFGETRVEWRESEGATHSLSYSHLSELRVHAEPSGPARLVAVEKSGRRWEMPLAADQVGSVQNALDAVDGHLASVAPASHFGLGVIRALVLGFGVALSITLGQIACALVTGLALIRAHSSLLVAAGVSAFASAALLLRESNPYPFSARIWMATLVLVVGTACLAFARAARRDETAPPPIKHLAALGLACPVAIALLALGGLNPVRLHQNAVEMPAAVILSLGLAGALIVDRRRRVRLMAGVPALLGAVVAAAGSLTFLDHVASDPFLVTAGPAAIERVTTEPSVEWEPSFSISTMQISPAGRAIAVQTDEAESNFPSDRRSPTYYVGPAAGPLRSIAADDVVFVDDDRALALNIRDGAAEIREFLVAEPAGAIWRESVAGVVSGTLQASANGDEWQLLGWTRSRRIVRAVGRVGKNGTIRTEWAAPQDHYGWSEAMIARGGDAVYVATSYELSPFRNLVLSVLYDVARMRSESRLWHLDAQRRSLAALSRLEVTCMTAAFASEALVCSAFDGARTRLVTIDPTTAAVTPASTLWGRFQQQRGAAPGWVTGWLDSSPLALRLATNVAFQVPARPHEWIIAVAATDAAIGTVSYGRDGGSIIRVYRLTGRSASR